MWKVADAAAGPQVHREVGNVIPIQEDAAEVRTGKPDQDIKRCGLTCAVRSEQSNDFSLLNLQTNVIDNLAAAIRLGQLNSLENVHVYFAGFLRMMLFTGFFTPTPSTMSLSSLENQVNCLGARVCPFTLSTSFGMPPVITTFPSSA